MSFWMPDIEEINSQEEERKQAEKEAANQKYTSDKPKVSDLVIKFHKLEDGVHRYLLMPSYRAADDPRVSELPMFCVEDYFDIPPTGGWTRDISKAFRQRGMYPCPVSEAIRRLFKERVITTRADLGVYPNQQPASFQKGVINVLDIDDLAAGPKIAEVKGDLTKRDNPSPYYMLHEKITSALNKKRIGPAIFNPTSGWYLEVKVDSVTRRVGTKDANIKNFVFDFDELDEPVFKTEEDFKHIQEALPHLDRIFIDPFTKPEKIAQAQDMADQFYQYMVEKMTGEFVADVKAPTKLKGKPKPLKKATSASLDVEEGEGSPILEGDLPF